jgi:acyl carrier protein
MIVDNIQDLITVIRSKPGYFDNMLDHFNAQFDELTPDNVSWGSTGMDDLDFVEMIMNFEKDFDITIPDDFVNVIENTSFYEFYRQVSLARIREDKLNDLGI